MNWPLLLFLSADVDCPDKGEDRRRNLGDVVRLQGNADSADEGNNASPR